MGIRRTIARKLLYLGPGASPASRKTLHPEFCARRAASFEKPFFQPSLLLLTWNEVPITKTEMRTIMRFKLYYYPKNSSRNSNCFSSKREKKPRQKLNQPTKIDSNIKDNPLRRTTATRAVLSIPFLLSQTVRLSLSPFLISSRKLTTTVHGWQQ